MTQEFTSTNNVPFEAMPSTFPGTMYFKVGTCRGMYDYTGDAYRIIAIENDEKNNGNFQDVLDWFENSCKRDGKDLQFVELWNESLSKHLEEKRGFKLFKKPDTGLTAIKHFN